MIIHTQLFKHQIQTIQWMKTRNNGCLALEMGTGKTLCVLHQFVENFQHTHITLYVCPKSLINQIHSEFFKHIQQVEPHTVHIYHGHKRFINHKATFIITTYDTLVADLKNHNNNIFDIPFKNIILDEAHIIKNHKTLKHIAVSKLSSHTFGNKWCLTGTPIINSINDIHSLRKFLDNHSNLDIEQWKQQFFFFVPKNAISLPSITYIRAELKLLPIQQKLYKITNDNLELHHLAKITKLKQIAIHHNIHQPLFSHSNKTTYIQQTIEFANTHSHKVIIFSQYNSILLKLHKFFNNSLIFIGTTNQHDRHDIIHKFTNTDYHNLLFINYQCGAVGLNLANNHTTHIILIEPWWNHAIEQQAIDRVHRFGQTQPVLVHRLISTDTIDHKIQDIQHNKSIIHKQFINIF